MSDNRTRMLTLAKALIAVAWADHNISKEEKHCLKDIIFHLSDSGLSAEERRQFLVLLFHIAAADGAISFDETEEIRLIATGIHLSHQDFINAKVQVTKA